MNSLKLKIIVVFLFMMTTIQMGFAQYLVTATANDGSYSVQVEISIDSVYVSSNSCQWGYNYKLHINYRTTFSGNNPPHKLYYVAITSLLDNKGENHGATLNNTAGNYSALTYTKWTNSTDCASITPNGLGLGIIKVRIEGRNLDETINADPGSGTLPIELISFTAKNRDDSRVELNWTTATEENNDYFSIERSEDAQHWEVIMDIPAAGNSNAVLHYDYTDNQAIAGQSYYRLKQTDYDGAFSYSKIFAVKIQKEQKQVISAYPNPAIDRVQLRIEGVESDMRNIQIYNLLGQDFTSKVSISQTGSSQYTMDFSGLPRGMYIIRSKNAFTKVYKQ